MTTNTLIQKQDYFQIIKQFSIIEIARRYLPGESKRQGSRWVARCPFHQDKTPSLVVFEDGWKCFGCGERGDGVDLVARLYNLRPLDAARMIAADFGIHLPPGNGRNDVARTRQAAARRELETRFQEREREVFNFLAGIYRSLSYTLAGIRDMEDLDRLGDIYHVEAILEHMLDVLRTGTARERAAILKNERLKRVVSRL